MKHTPSQHLLALITIALTAAACGPTERARVTPLGAVDVSSAEPAAPSPAATRLGIRTATVASPDLGRTRTTRVTHQGRNVLARSGEAVVGFLPGVTSRDVAELLGRLGARETYASPWTGARLLALPADVALEDALEALAASPLVRFAQPNAVLMGSAKGGKPGSGSPPPAEADWSADPAPFPLVVPTEGPGTAALYPHQWNLHRQRVGEAWDRTNKLGSTVRVAVLDSGVSPVASLPAARLAPGADFIDHGTAPDDDNGHGTHMATLIAGGAPVVGVAPEATVVPVRVLDDQLVGSELALVDGLYFAADEAHADVINMSLTFPAGYFPSRLLTEAVAHVAGRGIVMVAASGNDGVEAVGYPARFPEVIAVGSMHLAANTKNSMHLGASSYSNHGGALDLTAFGGDVTRDEDGDGVPDGILGERPATWQGPAGAYLTAGTSPASAQVAGAAALLLANGCADDLVRPLLQASAHADSEWGPGFDEHTGMGLLSVGRALDMHLTGVDPAHWRKPIFVTPVLLFESLGKNSRAVWPTAVVEVRDEHGTPVPSATVFMHFGGLAGTGVQAVTDERGVAMEWGPQVPDADQGFVALTVDAVVMPSVGLPVRPHTQIHVERLSLELFSNFGTGLASSAFVVDYSPDAIARLGVFAENQRTPSYSIVSLGAGLASSAIVYSFTPTYFETSGLWQSTLLFRTEGTGLASSALVVDQGFFNPIRLPEYGLDTLTVRSYSIGAGLASSAIIWDGQALPYDYFFTGTSPRVFMMTSGSGLASSALIWDGGDLLSPTRFYGPSTLGWMSNVTGTGLASSALIADYGELAITQLAFSWPSMQLRYPTGTGLASSALVANYDPYLYLTGSFGYLDPTLSFRGMSEATIPFGE